MISSLNSMCSISSLSASFCISSTTPQYPYSHNGHMIKFQYFEKTSSLNCHFKNLGTFVVSIAHYMRAYFNYQALTYGNDFMLPGDVGFLNVSNFLCYLLPSCAAASLTYLSFSLCFSSLPFAIFSSVRHAQGNCQERKSTLRQNRMSTSRNLYVDEASTYRIHRQTVLESLWWREQSAQ